MSNVRYGEGVTREVGWDVVNLGVKNLGVITDKNVSLCHEKGSSDIHMF